MEDVKVFISHAEEERELALKIKEILKKHNIMAWTYERDLPFGEDLATRLERDLTECDHLLVILSDSARSSQWVAREIGLALNLHKQRGELYPSIIGVRSDRPCESLEFWPREFRSGQLWQVPYSFSNHRYFNLGSTVVSDDLNDLASQLLPKVTFITETDGIEGQLLLASFKCYESLFPDESMRDDPTDIKIWIDEARRAREIGIPWREIYAILHMGELVIGMAFLSAHLSRHWCFGNYFGVRESWRQNHRAEMFIDSFVSWLRIIDPGMKGILFEAESVNLECLAEASRRETVGGHPEEEEVLLNLRHLRRLVLYQTYGALAMLGSNGRPLPYWQPAMEENLSPEDERELILMIRPLEGINPEELHLEEFLEFVYDDLYGDAYGGAGSIEIPGYRSYVESIKNRVKIGAIAGWRLGKVSVDRAIRSLLYRAHREGFSERLAL